MLYSSIVHTTGITVHACEINTDAMLTLVGQGPLSEVLRSSSLAVQPVRHNPLLLLLMTCP